MSPGPTEKLLVLFFDRLPPRWLGCYGCDWLETPEFDAFAADALVFDNAFRQIIGPGIEPWGDGVLLKLAEGGLPIERDDLLLADLAGSMAAGEDGEATEQDERVAVAIENLTDFFAENERGLYWLDLQTALDELLADQLPEAREPAEAGIATLVVQADFLLGMIREILEQNGWDESVSILLTAAEGCPLPDQKAGSLISSDTQLPLILRCPGAARGERRSQLCDDADLAETLPLLFGSEAGPPGLKPLFDSDRTEVHEYLLQTNGSDTALRHADWLFIAEAGGANRLYQKPADRYEINDLGGKFVDWCEEARLFVEGIRSASARPPLPVALLDLRFAVESGSE